MCCAVFISEAPLVADNFFTTIWIRIGRISPDNPAGRFGCYNAASSELDDQSVVRTSLAGVLLAFSWYFPILTH
jgi:hypothetical protein